jgi:predicted RNase H-like HicB family nuclease
MTEEHRLDMEITANIHREDDAYWAEVPTLPGCFASGRTLDELVASLVEGVQLYLADDQGESRVAFSLRAAVLSDGAPA